MEGKLTCLQSLPGGETLSRKHGLQIFRPDPLILKKKQGFLSTLPLVTITSLLTNKQVFIF
jgi:hypothetical protein